MLDRLHPRERALLITAAATTLVLRAMLYFRYRFDSDEPQHLHVAWGWTKGLVQYRDLFDNHTPLFHLLTAPMLGTVGERANVLLFMRAPMLLLFGIVVAGTAVIAERFWSTRVGVWSALLLAVFPPFFLKSLEYRTDNLWNALWIVALVVLTEGALTRRRFFAVGVLMGAAFATSMKTPLLVATLLIAAAICGMVERRRLEWRRLLPAVAGFAIIPAIVCAEFALRGALDDLVYCVFTFNGRIAETRPYSWLPRLLWPFVIYAIFRGARRWYASRAPLDPAASWRLFFGVASATYLATLLCFWIIISPRDMLAVFPLLAIFVAAALLRTRNPVRSLAVAIALCLVSLYYYADRFQNRTDEFITMMDQVLGVSRPGEMLMDYKGETIFRRRPYYPIFEALTREQMRRAKIEDTIAADIVRTRCYVAQADGAFWPPMGRQFMAHNFLDLGRIRAAGQWIASDGTFSIAIPGKYVVIDEDGVAQGTINGSPNAPREFGAGTYRFAPAPGEKKVAVIWAPAIERGYSPFKLRDRDF